MLSVGVPSHEYNFQGEAALGDVQLHRRLRMTALATVEELLQMVQQIGVAVNIPDELTDAALALFIAETP